MSSWKERNIMSNPRIEMPIADFVPMVSKNRNCGGRWELRRKKCGNLLKNADGNCVADGNFDKTRKCRRKECCIILNIRNKIHSRHT